MSNLPCSLSRNITSHSMENLAFLILTTWPILFKSFHSEVQKVRSPNLLKCMSEIVRIGGIITFHLSEPAVALDFDDMRRPWRNCGREICVENSEMHTLMKINRETNDAYQTQTLRAFPSVCGLTQIWVTDLITRSESANHRSESFYRRRSTPQPPRWRGQPCHGWPYLTEHQDCRRCGTLGQRRASRSSSAQPQRMSNARGSTMAWRVIGRIPRRANALFACANVVVRARIRYSRTCVSCTAGCQAVVDDVCISTVADRRSGHQLDSVHQPRGACSRLAFSLKSRLNAAKQFPAMTRGTLQTRLWMPMKSR